jgi:type IV secretory pathway component VirB8
MSDETTVIAALKPKRVRMFKEDYVSQITILKIDLHNAQVAARNLAEENIRLLERDSKLTCAVSVLAVIATVLAFALAGLLIGGAR